MYHYVRDLKRSNYPKIKGLDIKLFNEQLRYIKKYYRIVKMEDLIETIDSQKKLPDNALLLTFDDGYADHFKFVFPILDRLNIQGSFFPSVKPIEENKILDANKIHFILASAFNIEGLVIEICSMLDKIRGKYFLRSNKYYYKRNAKDGVFDTKNVAFIKKMLQKELPVAARTEIVDYLFHKYVTADESSFSQDLYMSAEQLVYMKEKGMYIGSHGYNHDWMDMLPKEECEKELDISLEFLKKIGCNKNFVFCYPYGGYSKLLLSLLRKRKCCLALTTYTGVADLSKNDPLILPRLDTNDLPKNNLAFPNKWTSKILK